MCSDTTIVGAFSWSGDGSFSMFNASSQMFRWVSIWIPLLKTCFSCLALYVVICVVVLTPLSTLFISVCMKYTTNNSLTWISNISAVTEKQSENQRSFFTLASEVSLSSSCLMSRDTLPQRSGGEPGTMALSARQKIPSRLWSGTTQQHTIVSLLPRKHIWGC